MSLLTLLGRHAGLQAPTNLVATANGSTQIDLTWTDNATADGGYKIEHSLDQATWTQVGTTAANATSYSDTSLSASTLYYYRVRAFKGGRNGPYSATVSATTGAAGPDSSKLIDWWALEELVGSATSVGLRNSIVMNRNNNPGSTTGKVGVALNNLGDANFFRLVRANGSDDAPFLHLDSADESFWCAAWVNGTNLGATTRIIASLESVWELRYDGSTSRFQFRVSHDGATWGAVSAAALGAPSTGTWYCLVAYHDGPNNLLGISVNGGAFDTAAHTAGAQGPGVGAFTIAGTVGGGNRWHGAIDEVAYFRLDVPDLADAQWFYNANAGRAYAELT